jgi:hypothetical protein
MNMTVDDHAAVGRLLKARWRGLASRANLEKAGRGYWVLPVGTTVDMVPELVRAWVFSGLKVDEIPKSFAIFEARLKTAWGRRLVERVEARPDGVAAALCEEEIRQ